MHAVKSFANVGAVQALFLLSVFSALPAQADVVLWDGAGQSGLDPFGHQWLTQNTAFQGVTSWGIPGRSQGITAYNGTRRIVGIEVEFFDLPAGVTIQNGPSIPSPTMNVTPFSSADLWVWTQLSPSSGRFDPPTPDRDLGPSDSFFYHVTFTNAVDFGTFNFQARYELSAVPEPSSTLLVSVFGVLLVRSRVRHKGDYPKRS